MPIPPAIDVLLVEDDLVLTELLVHAIRQAGLATDVAGDVVEAKRLLGRGNYKVLVLDLLLPDGEGAEVLSYIRSERIPPPQVIVATGTSDLMRISQLDRTLVRSVVFKPLDIGAFVQTIVALSRLQPVPPV